MCGHWPVSSWSTGALPPGQFQLFYSSILYLLQASQDSLAFPVFSFVTATSYLPDEHCRVCHTCASEFHSSSRFLRVDILTSYSAPHASETSPANRMQTCLAALNLWNVDGHMVDLLQQQRLSHLPQLQSQLECNLKKHSKIMCNMPSFICQSLLSLFSHHVHRKFQMHISKLSHVCHNESFFSIFMSCFSWSFCKKIVHPEK